MRACVQIEIYLIKYNTTRVYIHDEFKEIKNTISSDGENN
jgi:hypothetical protein